MLSHPNPLLLAFLVLQAFSSSAIAASSGPEKLIHSYCKAMFDGAFTNTDGVKKMLRRSVPEAESMFLGGGDSSYIIGSCELIEKNIEATRATFRLRFKIFGTLVGGGEGFDSPSIDQLIDEVVLVKSTFGAWKYERFLPTERLSLPLAIRTTSVNRANACYQYEAIDELCPYEKTLERLRALKAQQSRGFRG